MTPADYQANIVAILAEVAAKGNYDRGHAQKASAAFKATPAQIKLSPPTDQAALVAILDEVATPGSQIDRKRAATFAAGFKANTLSIVAGP